MAYNGANPAEGIVSTGNSSIVNLGANGVFTGTSDDVTIYSNIKINVYSSHISATDGLNFQQSHDGVLWIPGSDVYTIPALAQKSFSIATNLKFFRVIYTNGATATTTLAIQTLYHKSDKQASSIRPQDGRGNDNDYIEMLSHLMGYNSLANAWNRVGVTSGNVGGNETLLDRLKVNASMRILDTSLAVGSQLVAATGTQALGFTVNTVDRATRQLGIASVKSLAIASQSTPFAAAAVGSTAGYDVSAAANVTFIVANTVDATAWTGNPVIVFEQSHNNVSWALLAVVRNDTVLSATTHTLPAGTANIEYMFDTAAEGPSFVRARVTTGTTTGGMTIVVQPGSFPFTPSVTSTLNPETTKIIGAINSIVNALPGGTNAIGNINELRAASTTVTTTSASGVAATLTLPAVAGQFHYITSLDIYIYATAARVGAAAPVVVTTTNLTGSPAFTFETAQAIGVNTPIQGFNTTTPLKSTTANTATTIVAPIATTGIWRITATYFTGA